MSIAHNDDDHKLIDKLLHDTARSFYLTLHALPNAIRWPFSIAYLLARATDTVADVVVLPSQERLSALNAMMNMIQTGQYTDELNLSISTLEANSSEYALLVHFKQIIALLYELDEDTRTDIIHVLSSIIQGQQFDIEHFPLGNNNITCLTTKKDLDNYTYWVAGCVGEFWTKLCIKKITNYSSKSFNELLPLAISFGKGLQLINILRDIPNDLKHNRCYLPLEQLQQYGLNPNTLDRNVSLLDPIVRDWHQQAIVDMRAGWAYLLTLNNRRIRAALVLPVVLGFATLYELQDTSYLLNKQPVKISRMKVKIFLLIAILSMVSKRALYLLRFFKFYSLLSG